MASRKQRRKGRHKAPKIIRRISSAPRLIRRRGKRAGSAPGTLVHTGPRLVEKVRIHMIAYNADEVIELDADSIEPLFPIRPEPWTTWINIDGLHDTAVLKDLGDRVGMHPLVLEDIVSIGQRPKLDDYDKLLYIVLRMLTFNDDALTIDEEQISLVVGSNFVISFQEAPGDVWDPVRDRVRIHNSQFCMRGSDYLAYSLMDAIIDGYYAILERVGDRLEDLESMVLSDPRQETINVVHHLKREMIVMRRAVWPVRDLLNGMIRDERPLIRDGTRLFLRDAYDHAVQVIDTVETLRDLVSGVIDLYLSTVSNRMNEIMKVLTIMSSIFIPLTFLAGVYGMNFTYMPELQSHWAYPVVLGIMVIVAGGMVVYFKRKKWI